MLVQDIKDLPIISSIPKLIALDTETLSKGSYDLEGWSFAYIENGKIKSFFIPVAYSFSEEESMEYKNIDVKKSNAYMKNLCKGRRVIFHNAGFDLAVLKKVDIDIPDDMYEDTMLLHWDLDTERRHGLKKIMEVEYGRTVVTYEEAHGKGFEEFSKYADNDAKFTLFLFTKLITEAKKHPKTYQLYRKYELPYVRVLQEMNVYQNYIRVNQPLLKKYVEMLKKEISFVESILKSQLGDINFNSNPQLGKVLEEKGIPVKRNKPTANMVVKASQKGEEAIGNYTIGEPELKKLKKYGLIIDVLLYNRHLTKLIGTYYGKVFELLERIEKDVYVYTGWNFNHIGTRTGRSSSDVNQYPRDKDVLVCTFIGYLKQHKIIRNNIDYLPEDKLKPYIDSFKDESKLDDKERAAIEKLKLKAGQKEIIKECYEKATIDIRKIFIAMPGKIFIDADFSQIELRVMAHLSKDPVMCSAFINGEDLHAQTARDVTKKSGIKISRQDAKPINFGLIYGLSAYGIKKGLGCSESVAKTILNVYFRVYRGVKTFIDGTHVSAAKSHYVQTILGRRRNIDTLGINDDPGFGKDEQDRKRLWLRQNEAKNSAVSTKVQGTASDLLKIAMINIHNEMVKKNECRIIWQVHDELLIECDKKRAEEINKKTKYYMENAYKLDVPVIAESGIANNWRDAHG
jgi:DNA polymerase I-like protein with 3'-5' exonuclease and polymerase domains